MKCKIVDRPNGEPDIEVDATPRCGLDFCDRCGDCLHCFGWDSYHPCENGHRWIVYADLSPVHVAELLGVPQ